MPSLRYIFAAMFPALLIAQGPAWQLAPGEAAIYRTDERREHHAEGDPRARFAFPEANVPQVPLLLASELAPDRRSVALTPIDIRALVPWLAFDLRTLPRGGEHRAVLPALVPFGQFTLQGRWQPAAADGAQRGEWQLTALPTYGRGPEQKDLREPTNLGGEGKGTLVIERRFDAAAGVVRSFHAELKLAGKPCPRYASAERTVTDLRMDWTLDRVVPHRAPEQQQAIDRAVQNGAAWLRKQITIPNRDELARDRERSSGLLAMALLTLLAAELPANDTVVAQGLVELRRREIGETYELALALAALERAHAPLRERDLLIRGALKAPAPRALAADELRDASDWTRRLLDNRDRAVDPAYRSRWRYHGDPGYDNSNTQYALLGLRSAALCGVPVSRTVWHAAAAHWLEGMTGPGDPRPLLLTHHAQAGQAALGAVAKRSATLVAPRGWDYGNEQPEAYGNMVSAGIASLVLCREGLLAGKDRRRPPELDAIDDAIDSGFAWWSQHRTVRRVPAASIQDWERHYHYGLYGLERACELAGVAWIDDWDWYTDGAHLLVLAQRPDGSFEGNIVDTCFGVLFLKKAALPVLTGPRRR